MLLARGRYIGSPRSRHSHVVMFATASTLLGAMGKVSISLGP
jgi:hypothetical protein